MELTFGIIISMFMVIGLGIIIVLADIAGSLSEIKRELKRRREK